MNAMRREGLSGLWAVGGAPDLRDIGRLWATIGQRTVSLEDARLKAETEFTAQIDDPRVTLVGSIAVIPVCGPVFNRGNLYSYFFGGAVISTIRAQLRKALAEDDVKAIVLRVDSPGGTTDGVSEFAAELFKARSVKPIIAIADTMMCSAAYWIAASAEEIIATPSAFIGSVGVFWEHEVISRLLDAEGIDTELIASSPEKVETSETIPLSDDAREHWQGIIDQMASMFATDVARGRGITAKQVKDTYGNGRAFLAGEAKRKAMVDRVATFEDTITRLTGGSRRRSPNATSGQEIAAEAVAKYEALDIEVPTALVSLAAGDATVEEPADLAVEEVPAADPVVDDPTEAATAAAESERLRLRAAARRRSLSIEEDHATV